MLADWTSFGQRAAGAAPPPPADLSAILRPILLRHPLIPALWGAIVTRGQLEVLGAVGVRKATTRVPVTPGDLIHLGSDTKAMTALLIGQLVQARQLGWSDTMADLFPGFRPAINASMAQVTIAELLQHTAGLPHDLDWRALERAGQPLMQQRLAAVQQALRATPRSPPGSRYAYSNVGYVILGAVVERKTGHPWEQVIADRLFRPLGMTTAGFGVPGNPGATDQPWGHRTVDGKPVPIQLDNPPVMGPAGRVHCDLADWARFVSQFCRRPNDGVRPLLDAPSLAQLTTPATDGRYAGGWLLTERPWAGGRALTHAGSNTMWYCVAWVAPGRGFGVLSAANTGDADAAAACDDVAAALIRLHDRGDQTSVP